MNPNHPQFTERAAPKGKLNFLGTFLTIDGEANPKGPGNWSVFFRLTGCRVGCYWCDTKYSWSIKQGDLITPEQAYRIILAVSGGCKKVTISGGEPLEQDGPDLWALIKLLVKSGFMTTIETAGTHYIGAIRERFPEQVYFVLDYKCSSAETRLPNLEKNYHLLEEQDVIKFVVATKKDFHEAMGKVRFLRNNLTNRPKMVMSPLDLSAGTDSGGAGVSLEPLQLLSWMRRECPSLDVGLNVQVHKYIWHTDAREEEDAT